MSDEIWMYAKFDGKCSACGYNIDKGAAIKFNTFHKTAKHVKCPELDYSGAEQRNIFDMRVKMAQDLEERRKE